MGKGRKVVLRDRDISPDNHDTRSPSYAIHDTMPRGDDDDGDDDVRRNHAVLFFEDVHDVVLCSQLSTETSHRSRAVRRETCGHSTSNTCRSKQTRNPSHTFTVTLSLEMSM